MVMQLQTAYSFPANRNRSTLSIVIWMAVIVAVFLMIAIFLVGPEYRRDLMDSEADLTLLRFSKTHDIFSLLVTNYSPVAPYSIPYGGWPPLRTFLSAIWLPLHISLPATRLLTGISLILAFGFSVLILAKRISPQADLPLVLAMALLSPVAISYVGLGTSHILIPLASLIPLMLLAWSRKLPGLLVLAVGFVLGLSDWNVYAIIPALLVGVMIRKKYPAPELDYRFLLNFVFLLAIGFVTAFLSYKLILLYEIKRSAYNTVLEFPGITTDKLLMRMVPSAKIYLSAIILSFVRIFLTILPIIILLAILHFSEKGKLSTISISSKGGMILFLAFLSPILYCMAFPGHVGIVAHAFQKLPFLAPVALLTGFIEIKSAHRNLFRFVFILILTSFSLFCIYSHKLLPDRFSKFASHHGLVSPLPPGNYDLASKPEKLSLESIIRGGIVKQFTFPPYLDKKLVRINAFNRTMYNFATYGHEIEKNASEDEIIIVFGDAPATSMFYTKRVVLGVSNYAELLELLKTLRGKFDKLNVAILVPLDYNVKLLDKSITDDYKITLIKMISGTPYKLIYLST